MMKSEFENLLGREVAPDEYEKIETVYMCFENMSKQEIADLYKRDSEFVTSALYNHVLDIDKTISKKNAKIDDLRKDLKNTSGVVESMVVDNDRLQACNDSLQKENRQLQVENDLLKDITVKYQVEDYKNKNRIEELETELEQYRTMWDSLFLDLDTKGINRFFTALLSRKGKQEV